MNTTLDAQLSAACLRLSLALASALPAPRPVPHPIITRKGRTLYIVTHKEAAR